MGKIAAAIVFSATLAAAHPGVGVVLTRYSFVRDAAGNMYRAGPADCSAAEISKRTAVCRIAPDGTTMRIAGPAGFADIRWMTAAPDAAVYLIDLEKLWRVKPGAAAHMVAAYSRLRRTGPFRFSIALRESGVTVTRNEVVVLEYSGTKARVRRLRHDGSIR